MRTPNKFDLMLQDIINRCDDKKVRAMSHNLVGVTQTRAANDLSIFNGRRFSSAVDDVSVSGSVIVVGTEKEECILLTELRNTTGARVTGSYNEEMTARYFDLYCEKEGALLINLK